MYPSICLPIYVSIHSSIYLSIYLPLHLFMYLLIHVESHPQYTGSYLCFLVDQEIASLYETQRSLTALCGPCPESVQFFVTCFSFHVPLLSVVHCGLQIGLTFLKLGSGLGRFHLRFFWFSALRIHFGLQ
jgi:hypothetical protein